VRSLRAGRPLSTAFADPYDITDHRDRAESRLRNDPAEPMEKMERKDPTEPTERADPTEPIERIEPLEAIDSTEFSEAKDHRDDLSSLMPGILRRTGCGLLRQGSRRRNLSEKPSCHAPGVARASRWKTCPVLVQIYGLTTAADAKAVDELGADHIGVVLNEGLGTWDSVDPATALAVRDEVSAARLVALSLSTEPRQITSTVELIDPDIVHLARGFAIDPDRLDRLRATLDRPLMVTVPVTTDESVRTAHVLAEVADYLLLDTTHPDTGVVGATGLVHDWSLSAAIVSSVTKPVFLAGGLGPHNVADAIRTVKPEGVDSETNTSDDADRRRKDLAKVRSFIEIARAVDRTEDIP
jgi:phosphoribosylanthranilate isomerase